MTSTVAANNGYTRKASRCDLADVTVGRNGKAKASFTVEGANLADGADSLFHEGGTSVVIHANADDFMSDPSGNSGDHVACGVIEK